MAETTKLILRVIVVGNNNVGKGRLLEYYASQQQTDSKPMNYVSQDLEIDGRSVTLQIWDTAGQERFQSLGVTFYRCADCCILVYDVTSAESFKSLDRWRDELLIKADPADPENYPFVVIGNRIELDNRVVTRETAEKWCRERDDIPYFETPSNGDSNVEKAFETAARNAIIREKYNTVTANFLNSFRLTDKKNSDSSKKCSC